MRLSGRAISIQGAACPLGALSPLLPASVKKVLLLPNVQHCLKVIYALVNGLRRLCCDGVMFLDWPTVCCSVLLCYYCVHSGMLHVECICGGVANAGSWHSIYQSIIQKINGDFTFLVNVLSIPSYEARHSPSQWVLNILRRRVVMTSLFDGFVFLSVGLCLLICTTSLQHMISPREPVHARPVEKSRRITRTRNWLPPKAKWCVERTHR
jgi:hypothetical protein